MSEEGLGALLQKLKANREKVPAELLRTRYAAAYGKLKGQISQALKEEAAKIPEDLRPAGSVPPWLPEAVGGIFSRALEESALAPKLRRAIYKRYDAAEALAIAREINKGFVGALAGYAGERVCLVLDVREPAELKIYNYYLGMYWNMDAGAWRMPREDEAVPDAGSLWEDRKK